MSIESEPAESLSIRTFKEGDEQEMLRLYMAAFGEWPRVETDVDPIEHLRWKLRSHAASGGMHVVVESGSRIVAAEMCDVQAFKVADRTLLARQRVDIAVHPECQGQGVYTKMTAFAAEIQDRVLDVHLSTGRHPAVARVSSRRLGRRAFGNQVQILVKPLDVWATVAGGRGARPGLLRLRPARAVALAALRVANRLRCRPRGAQDRRWTTSEVSAFDDRIDRFWEQASQPYNFIGVRNRDYLNWRYGDARGGRFLIKLAEENESILGYVVVRVSRGWGYIADLLTLPGRLDVAAALVEDALQYFRQRRVPAIECWLPEHHPYQPVLRSRGFLSRRRDDPVVFQPLRAPESLLAFLDDPRASVHFMLGDSDLV